jgi:hypothetical protein
MLTVFRKIRKQLLSENNFTRYVTYAAGETVLIVIGILIALEISNANEEKIEALELEGYLQTIAKNLETDLVAAKVIYDKRISLRERLSKVRLIRDQSNVNSLSQNSPTSSSQEQVLEIEQATFISNTFTDLWALDHLNSNTSGFESLKSSGYLSKLQQTDLEEMLLNYYNLVDDIVFSEDRYNAMLFNANTQLNNANLAGILAFYAPQRYHWNGAQGVTLSQNIFTILNHPSLLGPIISPHYLIAQYHDLQLLGHELKRMIDSGITHYDDQAVRHLARIYGRYSDKGYATVLHDGTITGAYSQGQITSEWGKFFVNINSEQHITLNFIEQDWGVFYLFVGQGAIDANNTADYSGYRFLRLEMRGSMGGEQVSIAMKDSSNPQDGSEIRVPLTVTQEWTYYEIPLEEFYPTDITDIFMVTSFIFTHQAAQIDVRNIEFVY